jgi:hypothetical protein
MMLTKTIKRIIVATYCRAPGGIVISTALILLLTSAIILTIGKKYLALQLGDYAFYFLTVGVILNIIKLISREPGRLVKS